MTTDEKLIKKQTRVATVSQLPEVNSVSEACRMMGCSQDTFERIKKAHEEGGVEALRETTRRRPNLHNRIPEDGGGPQKLDSVLSSDSDHSWRI